MLPVLFLSAVLMQSASDSAASAHIDDYKGHYGKGLNPREEAFNANIVEAYHAKEQAVGNLEGSWRLSDAAGIPLMQFELRAPKSRGGDIEGAWRSLVTNLGIGKAGFVSSLSLSGDDLEINWFVGHARSPEVLHLHRIANGNWQGTLMEVSGARSPVSLQRVHPLAN